MCNNWTPLSGMPTDPADFWDRARDMAEGGHRNFKNWSFPRDPSGQGFSEIHFKCIAEFRGATFLGGVDFSGAKFSHKADFNNANFDGTAKFHKTEFQRRAEFGGAKFVKNAEFIETHFVDCVDFSSAEFKGESEFSKTTFGRECLFCRTTFEQTARYHATSFFGTARFDGTRFQEVSFSYAKFEQDAAFWGATFCGAAMFHFTVFGMSAYFNERLEGKGEHFEEAVFYDNVDFHGSQARDLVHFCLPRRSHPFRFCLLGRKHPFRKVGAGETAYRLAKQAAQNHGISHMAGEYHYAENCAQFSNVLRLRHIDNVGKLNPVFWISWLFAFASHLYGYWVFGYGERPRRPALCCMFVILLFAVFYSFDNLNSNTEPQYTIVSATMERVPAPEPYDSVIEESFGGNVTRDESTLSDKPVQLTFQIRCEPSQEKPMETRWTKIKTSLYFSVVTFTTLGYGDYQPGNERMRMLAGLEALLGAGLIATFIVGLTRKHVR